MTMNLIFWLDPIERAKSDKRQNRAAETLRLPRITGKKRKMGGFCRRHGERRDISSRTP
jgi:hypothetical protein